MLNIARVSGCTDVSEGALAKKITVCVLLGGLFSQKPELIFNERPCFTHSSRILAAGISWNHQHMPLHLNQNQWWGPSEGVLRAARCTAHGNIFYTLRDSFQYKSIIASLFSAHFTMLSCSQCVPAGRECFWCIILARVAVAEGCMTVR